MSGEVSNLREINITNTSHEQDRNYYERNISPLLCRRGTLQDGRAPPVHLTLYLFG
jgi:hypothetical protein